MEEVENIDLDIYEKGYKPFDYNPIGVACGVSGHKAKFPCVREIM